MSGNDIFSSDEEDYEPELKADSDGEYDVLKEVDEEEVEEEGEEEPEISIQDKLESQKKLDKKNEIKQKIPDGITLFLDLEDKTEEALGTFTSLEKSTYGNKSLGSSGQGGEFMSCECQEYWDGDVNSACNDDYCINRGTKIECINGHSSCGNDCSNQRFQKQEYAPINVIQTAKKGYGVRAEKDIEPDTFIYEYIGEVIDEKAFKRRMIEYDELNFKHFYFMMLQKGEFIDATRKGCLARFCNHSCNPNCYVEKWVVGHKLKMGIFAKRRILKGEEVTFDYNVDRYGANAQPCYCGEPNCIGFIGGKTQTEAASLLPQFISEALGSTIEDEQEFLREKQDKNEKIVKNDNNMNVEYINSLIMKPIDIFEVNKVMGVLLQCEESLIAEKLIERIELSNQQAIQYKLSYAHGYTSLGRLLKNYYEGESQFKIDDDLVLRILKILQNWPKVSKTYINKVEIIPTVSELIENTNDDEIVEISRELLDRWASFEEFKRIKKSDKRVGNKFVFDSRRQHRNENLSPSRSQTPPDSELPPGWHAAKAPTGDTYYFKEGSNLTQWEKPQIVKPEPVGWEKQVRDKPRFEDQFEKEKYESERRERELYQLQKEQREREMQKRDFERRKEREMSQQANDLAKIIANAKRLEEQKLAKEREIKKLEEAKKRKKEEYKRKMSIKKSASTSKEGTPIGSSSATSSVTSINIAAFEKNWSKFFAQYIPNMLKKYRDEIGHDNLKQCAKDITKILVDKEFKKDSTKKPPSELDNEKRKKVKQFVEAYMDKFLIKYRAKHQKRRHEGDHHNGGSKKVHP